MTGDGKHKGHSLGEYQLIDPDMIIYKQSSSEQQDEKYVARYIYRVEGIGWHVGPKVGDKLGWLKNPSLSTTLPRSGWKWADANGTSTWLADDSITVNEGRLISDCTEIIITLTGASGVFKLQPGRMFNGRHIYKNEEDYFLHCNNGVGWGISRKLDYYSITSKSAPMVPSSYDEWEYWTGSEGKEAKVEVTCIPTN